LSNRVTTAVEAAVTLDEIGNLALNRGGTLAIIEPR
jgi:hypothetical protein